MGKFYDILCIYVYLFFSGYVYCVYWLFGYGICIWIWSRGICCLYRVVFRVLGVCVRIFLRVGGGLSNFLGCFIFYLFVLLGDDFLGIVSVKYKIYKFYIFIFINYKYVIIEEDVSVEYSYNESIREVSMKCKIIRLI